MKKVTAFMISRQWIKDGSEWNYLCECHKKDHKGC